MTDSPAWSHRHAQGDGDHPGATRALAAAKRLVWSGLGSRVEAQLPEAARTVAELSGTGDARQGLAAVIEGRAPGFRGR
jgi:2-(1,2-epoxy-1,2-dihydrophenyl)acetyl-CoA isomerase